MLCLLAYISVDDAGWLDDLIQEAVGDDAPE